MQVVINTCYGGFGLSPKALTAYAKRKGLTLYWFEKDYSKPNSAMTPIPTPTDHRMMVHPYTSPEPLNEHYYSYYNISRDDPDLIAVVKELGHDADGAHAQLRIIDIPDGTNYTIEEYDGIEHIAEAHRTWA